MPKLSRQLTDIEIKRAKPGEKGLKLSDGDGLYIECLVRRRPSPPNRVVELRRLPFNSRGALISLARWQWG